MNSPAASNQEGRRSVGLLVFVVITVIGLHRLRSRSVPRRLSVARAKPSPAHPRAQHTPAKQCDCGSKTHVAEGQDMLCSQTLCSSPEHHQADVMQVVSQSPPPSLSIFPPKKVINCTSAARSSLCQNNFGFGSTAAPRGSQHSRCSAPRSSRSTRHVLRTQPCHAAGCTGTPCWPVFLEMSPFLDKIWLKKYEMQLFFYYYLFFSQ